MPHERVLTHIQSLGITNNYIYLWMRNLLIEHRYADGYSGEVSAVGQHNKVPQGSVLGPLLFSMVNCVISTLLSWPSPCLRMTITVWYYHWASYSQQSDLQVDIDSLQDWTMTMQMLFQPLKCKAMHIGAHKPNRDYAMTTNMGRQHRLETVREENDLGVTIDRTLNFSKHITSYVKQR